jgi:dTDP-D-glucose 4,6-dehydratase
MKKIIVTGGLGFIGSNLIELLLKKNFSVINIDKVTYSSNFYNTQDFSKNTLYKFTLDDGATIEAKGNDEIEYDGETHSAANLYDALKEGYYGKF